MTLTKSDIVELERLENALWSRETRLSTEWMDGVLGPRFVEIGASGRVHSREDVLDPLSVWLEVEAPLRELEVSSPAPGVALVRYVSVQRLDDGGRRCARRTSLWVMRPEGWKLEFHQGTMLPGVP